MVDYSNAGLTGNYPWDVELRTSGPNSVIVWMWLMTMYYIKF